MKLYLLQRFSLAVLTLLVILFVSYSLLRLAPGDPARGSLLGDEGNARNMSSEKGAFTGNRAIREKLHLDKPIITGFGLWFKAVITRGDFGSSAVVDPGKPVTQMILERLPVTLSLNFFAILITYFAAVLIGVYAAVYADSLFDRSSAAVLFFLYSLPSMWVALLLQSLICEGGKFPLFPLKGIVVPGGAGMSSWELLGQSMRYYALPVFCLSYAGLAGLSRYARGGMLEVIHSDYIRTARAKGVSEFQVIWSHAFNNALITLITLFSGLLPALITGSVIIEFIFNIPGMGALSLLALSSRDYPLFMAIFAFGSALSLAGILISDLLYLVADPRISLQSSR
ncbi:MAG: ABC transporter permease [Victivallaceae bacterium]